MTTRGIRNPSRHLSDHGLLARHEANGLDGRPVRIDVAGESKNGIPGREIVP